MWGLLLQGNSCYRPLLLWQRWRQDPTTCYKLVQVVILAHPLYTDIMYSLMYWHVTVTLWPALVCMWCACIMPYVPCMPPALSWQDTIPDYHGIYHSVQVNYTLLSCWVNQGLWASLLGICKVQIYNLKKTFQSQQRACPDGIVQCRTRVPQQDVVLSEKKNAVFEM